MRDLRLISTISWAKRFVKLDGKPFDPSNWPQLVEIADCIDRRMGATFIMRFPPQVFKTLLMQLRLLRCVAVEPQRSLWYATSQADADAFSDSKLSPLVRDIQPIRDKYPHDPDARGGKNRFLFVDCPVELLSADNQSHRNGKSGHDLYLDETWQYEPGNIAEIRARSDSYERVRRILMAETAPEENHESDRLFQKSPQRTWHLACIHCNKLFEPLWGDTESAFGMKWDRNETTKLQDGSWNESAAAKTARYVCPHCAGEIRFSESTLRLLNDPKRGACYITRNDNADPKIEAWTANALCFRDWGGLVSEWLTACNAKRLGEPELIEEFTKKKLVKAWSPRSYLDTVTEYPVGAYRMYEEWADEGKSADGLTKFRFITVDVQQNCYWAVCRSWALDGRSRLYAFRKLYTQPEVAEFAKQCGVPAWMVWMDSAYDPKDRARAEFWGRTMQMCAVYGFKATNGIPQEKFLHADGIRRMYSPPQRLDGWIGTQFQGKKSQVLLFNYHSQGAKGLLSQLRSNRHQTTGEWMWTFAQDTGEEYIKQAYGEVVERKKHPKGGWVTEWRQIYENHIFDMECVQAVIACYFGLVGVDAVLSPTVYNEPSKENGA